MQFQVECNFDWFQVINHFWAGKFYLGITLSLKCRWKCWGERGKEWVRKLDWFKCQHFTSFPSLSEGRQETGQGSVYCLWLQLERAMVESFWHQSSFQSSLCSHFESVIASSSGSRAVILPDFTSSLLPQSLVNLPAPSSYTNQRPFSLGIKQNSHSKIIKSVIFGNCRSDLSAHLLTFQTMS